MVLFAANNLLAQNAFQEEAKGDTTAKVNVDNKGIILKGYDAVARAPIRAPHTCLPQRRIKPISTKIPQSMRRGMADFVPTG
jgi:hypothetical protein